MKRIRSEVDTASIKPACGPQIALRPSSLRPLGPAGTDVSSWSSWSLRTVAATTCVRPTTAAASTSTSSASGQVLAALLSGLYLFIFSSPFFGF